MRKVYPILVFFLAWVASPLMGAAAIGAVGGALNEAGGVTSEQVLKWSADTLVNAYSFDYKSMDQSLQNLHTDFTDKGYQAFKDSLENSHFSQLVQTKKLDVTPVFDGQGDVLQSGVEDGVYNWTIQIPLVLHLRGPYEMIKQKKLITLKVKRAALSDYSSGLAIDDFSSKDTR